MGFFIGYQRKQSNMDELTYLENKVKELRAWKNARLDERLRYPLDIRSKQVLQKDVLVFTGKEKPSITNLLSDYTCLGLELSINGEKRAVLASYPLYQFSAAVTDIITYGAGSFTVNDNDTIAVVSTNLLPGGLTVNTVYYVINATATTFKVSLSQGGSAVDITNTGTGSHYFAKL